MFYFVAGLDLIKNILLPLISYNQSGVFEHVVVTSDMRAEIFGKFISAVIYAFQWVAYGVFAEILIAIFDKGRGE
jgi:hypothetical protein